MGRHVCALTIMVAAGCAVRRPTAPAPPAVAPAPPLDLPMRARVTMADALAGDGPGDCVELPVARSVTDDGWGPVLTDLAQHLENDNPWYRANLVTAAHESSHVLGAMLAARHPGDGHVDGFYLLGGCGVVLPQPRVRKAAVADYVPMVLRGLRFEQYITAQTSYDAIPTYVLDEWVAYVNGAAAALELVALDRWPGPQDAMAGQLELMIYSLGLAMAVHDHDPDYLVAHPEFLALIARTATRTMTQLRAGLDRPEFPSDEQGLIYAALRTDPDAAAMRAFIRETWGDAYAGELLGP